MNALDLAYAAGAVLLSPIWARKARGGWNERFGRVEPLPTKTRPRVLLHAVSVGEVGTLRGLVPLLSGHAEVVVAAGTDTGLRRARELFATGPNACRVVRYPLDFSASVRRFLDAVQPDLVALVELEVWPNFVGECSRRNIPVGVINGRLSARSFKGYRRIRRFIGPSFASLSFAAVQDQAYADRFLAMGVPPSRLSITDSMKWDAARIEAEVPADGHRPGSAELAAALGIDRSRPLIVAGSTGPGEEALLYAACPQEVQLLCAPRKPERFREAVAALPGCTIRQTQPGDAKAVTTVRGKDPVNRFLLATIGELRAAYALADVVVMGRSFGKLHGSDPVEPIGLGKATIIGPRFGDFDSAVRALSASGGLRVVEPAQLGAELRRLLDDPKARQDMAERGRACIRAHQGATARHAELILRHLSRATPRADPVAAG